LIILLIGMLAVILSITAAWLITRSITKPIKRFTQMLTEGADQVASAAGQISSASQSLAEGSSEQAASIEETSSALEEMSAMTKQNADHAGEADRLMKASNQSLNQASNSMKDLTVSMPIKTINHSLWDNLMLWLRRPPAEVIGFLIDHRCTIRYFGCWKWTVIASS
jgi:methyl-accepting chemotaxis protein